MIEVKEIKNYEEFNSFKEENKESLHIVKVGAEWCGPCKMVSKLISSLNQESVGSTMFAEVDIEEEGNDDIVSEFGIRNIPVLLLFKNNELIEKKIGSLTADVLNKLIEEYK